MEKLSLPDAANGLTELAAVTVEVVVAEWGESPVDDGDMLLSTGLKGASRRTDDKVADGVQPVQRLSNASSTVCILARLSKARSGVKGPGRG